MQALARETNLSETVFVLPPSSDDADVRIRIFTPGERTAVRRPSDARCGVRARRAALEDRDPPRDRRRGRAGRARRARGRRIVFGQMEQPIPDWESEPNAGGDLRGARRRGLGAAGRALRARPGPRLRRARLARGGRRAAARPGRARARHRRRRQLLRARRRAALEDADVRARRTASARTRRRARPPGPLAIHLARHGRIAFGEQIEISQGAELNRPSTLYARRKVRVSASSACSSAARRLSSLAASSASEPDGLDLR